jgi:hypothetical protein
MLKMGMKETWLRKKVRREESYLGNRKHVTGVSDT